MKVSKAYFIGIGGIGMSALARHFQSNNAEVSGYDRTETKLTKILTEEGIQVYYDVDVNRIPKDVDLVVYTPAVPADNEELKYYRSLDYPVMKRSEVLGSLSKSMTTIAIAGTHGKSSVSAMITYLLKETEYDCTAFLGAICKNFDTNYLQGFNELMVVEADEFDRSFLTLDTEIGVITSVDSDHLDIYKTHEELQKAFVEFSKKINREGALIYNSDINLEFGDQMEDKISYSMSDTNADCYLTEHSYEEGKQLFSFVLDGELYENFKLSIGGLFNIENMLAAICVCNNLGMDPEFVRASIETYEGLYRRFDKIYTSENVVYIDDYAHHPTELNNLLQSVQSMFPGKKITVIFQPHLYSRTRDYADEFAKSLSTADEIILLPIYPAREEPIAGVSSEMILDKISNPNKSLVKKEDLMSQIKWNSLEILITAGAGDIDKEVKKIENHLNQQNAQVLE